MWTYFVRWFGAGSDQYPCHLCWINLIYHLNNLPAQFGTVTSKVNHLSLQKIRMIGMPFQTWLLDLYKKIENDCVTCFGNRTVMNCFSFQPGSGQYMPNTSKYPNHLSSQISTRWMHLEINAALHCLLSFPESPNVTFIRPCFTPSPLMTPFSPNTMPSPLDLRSCLNSKSASSGWSSVWGLLPRPGRRHMTWEARWSKQHTAHIIPWTCQNLTIALPIYKFRFHAARLTLLGQLTAWLKKWPQKNNFVQGTFLGNPRTWFLMILDMPGRTNS